MRYSAIFLIVTASCFVLQAVALHRVGGRTTKSESNYFSSIGRIQAGAIGEPEVMLLGSSITGRLPDRTNGYEGFANMGCDGGNAVSILHAIDKGLLPSAPVLIVEANTLNQALDGLESEIGIAITRTWFKVGVSLPCFSAYARPSAFVYSKLLKRKIGQFGSAGDKADLNISTNPVVLEKQAKATHEEERDLINDLLPVIQRLRERGIRIVFIWLPPERQTGYPVPPWIKSLVFQSGSEWWDLGADAEPNLVTLTDGIHMSAESAALTIRSIKKGLSAKSEEYIK